MMRVLHYFGRFQSLRSNFGGLPPWARFIVGVLAIPGIILIALSFVALAVSILALLLLTVPAYRLLSAVCRSNASPTMPQSGGANEVTDFIDAEIVDEPVRPKRNIEVKIVE